ncbi:hypothetical protein Gpo141_00000199 [Globisporangium polare]
MGAQISQLLTTTQSPLVHKYVVEVLKRSPFMQLLDDQLIADIARCFEVVKFSRGAQIKTDADQFFIVAEGAVDISSLIPMNITNGYNTNPNSTNVSSKQQVAEFLCQRVVGDYISYTSREQLLTRLLLASPDGNALFVTKKKLMKLLDLNKTSADATLGCTLLKLHRDKFKQLLARLSVRRPNVKNTARFSGGKSIDRSGSTLTAAEKIHLVKSIVESEIVSYLIDTPFLENVDESKLVTLSNLCSYLFVKHGQVLCQEGEIGDRFFICIRGCLHATVNVHLNAASQTYVTISSSEARQPEATATERRHSSLSSGSSSLDAKKIQTLKRMSIGSYFGEISLLFKIPRIASITAVEDSLLVYIDRATFCNFLKMVPVASLVLLEHVRMHFLDNLIKQGCPFLNAIPPIKLQELSSISELTEHQTGATIISRHEKRTAFYILLRGEVQMVYEDESPDVVGAEVAAYKENRSEVVLVRPGGYFGQEALILRGGSSVHVKCTDHCLTLKLSLSAFEEFFMTLPEVYSEFCIKCLRDKARPEHVMQHFEAHRLWSADCVGRRKHHDVSLFEYIEDFKWEADFSEDRIHERALVIYMRFLADTSPCPVNISVKVAQAIEHELCALSVDRNIFAAARDEILESMEDAHFAAFKSSHTFQEFLASLHCPQPIYDALTPAHEDLLNMSRKQGRGNLEVEDLDDDGDDGTGGGNNGGGYDEQGREGSTRTFRRNSATVFSVANSFAAASATLGYSGTRRDLSIMPSDRSDSVALGGGGGANRRKTRVDMGPRRISTSFVF